MPSDELTPEEERAIRALERLAKKWPPSLMLFANCGSLLVTHTERGDLPWPELAHIPGIPCDGGDAEWRAPDLPEEGA